MCVRWISGSRCHNTPQDDAMARADVDAIYERKRNRFRSGAKLMLRREFLSWIASVSAYAIAELNCKRARERCGWASWAAAS